MIEIRDGIRSTKGELTELRTELRTELGLVRTEIGELADRVTESEHRMAGRMTESELRQATRTTEQTAATRDLYAMLTGQLDLRDRVERCERDIVELKTRTG